MLSAFPGMDPFIEGQGWEDFHQGFIAELSAALVAQVRPRYVVRKERRIYVEHSLSTEDRAIRTDVAVLASDHDEPVAKGPESPGSAIAPVVISLPMPEERREAYLTIRQRGSMEVVAVIELLSPGNKRPGSDGRREYLSKREEILQSVTHLVELDLLRGGVRLPTADPLPPADYYVFVCREHRRYQADVYSWTLRHRLPQVPVPLAGDDPDVLVDLQQVFTSVYDKAGYDYSLDYRRTIEPPLSDADTKWAGELLLRK